MIGFTGSIGSGCTEISKNYLEEKKGFKYISLSEFIKKEVSKSKEKPTVLDYQDFGNDTRKKFGLDFLVRKVFEEDSALENNKKIVVDSIRNCGEVECLRRKFSNFYLMGIYADQDLRWNRLNSKFNGNKNLFDQAEERDQGEVWDYGQQVTVCMDLADIMVINNNDYKKDRIYKDELYKKIDGYIKLIQLLGSRKPTQMEIFMNKAYASSLRSDCLKRQVGAVLMDGEKGKIISEGFNRIPKLILKSCMDRYGYCYRDKQRDVFLDGLKKCSACGQDFNIPEKCTNNSCNFGITEHLKSRIKMLDFCRALHAEEDAILNALQNGYKDFENATLYTTTFPCLMCAKKIVGIGIKSIVFVEPYPVKMAEEILKNGQVEIKVFEGIKNISFYKLFKKERDFDKKIKEI